MKKIVMFMIVLMLMGGCSDEVHESYTTTTEGDVWGLSLTVTDITNSGITLIFNKGDGENIGLLGYGGSYYIQKNENNSFVNLMPISEITFTTDITFINESEFEISINWENYYGLLEAGEYRIVKEISDTQVDDSGMDYYGLFKIGE